MIEVIILILLVVIGFIAIKNRSVKSIFFPQKKYYSIDDAYNARRKAKNDEIDHLLSKMGKNGLSDLTEKERKRLDELSRK
ncbi:MAG TPA: rhomboid family protein [Chryseobacterium sp.]|nr:rhomboid family protein [Chryseobacterium sp.]